MRESVAYELIKKEGFDEGLQEGMHKGLREGMQKGLQEGVQKGLQEGIAQGLRQGVVQSSRRLLVDVLEERFEIVPRSVLRMIQEIDDPNILEMLHKAALRAESIQGFMEKVRAVVEL